MLHVYGCAVRDGSYILRTMRFITGIFVVCAFVLLTPSRVYAGVNDFTITNFHADYYLSKGSDGHANLQTVETITAEFPSYDQNHGIERFIPKAYDGHKTSLQVLSVQKADGQEWNVSTYPQGNYTVVRIGDADKYVHGSQTYRITYTQRDVTKYFADTNDDELYWDVNGTGWAQPFQAVSATVYIDASLAGSLTGNQSCGQGVAGSGEQCTITVQEGQNGGKLIIATATRSLRVGENMTFAIGFQPHTFIPYEPTAWEKFLDTYAWLIALAIFLSNVGGLIAIVWIGALYYRKRYRKAEIGPIAPEYIPPKGTSVMVAARTLSSVKGNAQTAELIDLAVRHYIKLYQVSEGGLFSRAEYEIEAVKPFDDLQLEEQVFLMALFGGKTRLALKDLSKNFGVQASLAAQSQQLSKNLAGEPYNLLEKNVVVSRGLRRIALSVLLVSLLTFSVFGLIAAFVAFISSFTFTRLTDKGLALQRYLLGLRDYIRLAETDRLRMLQSPEGAEKVGEQVNGQDKGQLIRLYERVLPYAVLFGEEKGWNEQLGRYYAEAQTQPEWYTGRTAFNAAVFSTAVSSFNQSVSSFSSSSGGSSGASSGGGGGGGGGGGW